MKLNGRLATVTLSEDGLQAMQGAAVRIEEGVLAVSVFVQDTDDMGLWVRIGREDGDHLLLIRWDYVVAVDTLLGTQNVTGLKP